MTFRVAAFVGVGDRAADQIRQPGGRVGAEHRHHRDHQAAFAVAGLQAAGQPAAGFGAAGDLDFGDPLDPPLDQFGERGRRLGWQVVGDGDRAAGVDLALRVEGFERPVAWVGLGE